MSLYRKITLLFPLYILFSVAALAQEMRFSAQLSSNKVGLREQFKITYTVINPEGSVSFREPALRDFMVISGPMQSGGMNVVDINGRVTQEFVVNYTYLLQPRRLGTLTIGEAGIRAQNGRQMSTRALQVKVTAENQGSNYEDDDMDFDRQMAESMRRRQQLLQQIFDEPEERRELPADDIKNMTAEHMNENIFMRAEVDNKNPYIGQQVNVVYKLYTRLKMSMAPTAFPSLNGFWAQEIKLPPTALPVQENYNGKRYNVFTLKKTALFPQQTGTLLIDQAKAQGKVEIAEPIGAGRYIPSMVDISLENPVVPIEVKPLPVNQKPAGFSGGVGQFSIAANLSQKQFSTDDIIQLTLTVNGSGNIGLISAPVLKLPGGLSAMDPEVRDSIQEVMPDLSGTKQFTYQISADSSGNYTIPALQFTYFDIHSNQYKTLSTDSFPVVVSKGTKPKILKGDAADQMKDIHGLMNSKPSFRSPGAPLWKQPYYWLLYVLALLGLAALLWRQNRKTHREQNADLYKRKIANKEAWKRLATARNALPQSDHTVFYEEVSKAIWLYLSDKLAIPLSGLNKDNIAQQLRFRGIEEEQIGQTLSLITECEMALYSPAGGQQQKQHTLDEAGRLIGIFENQFKKK